MKTDSKEQAVTLEVTDQVSQKADTEQDPAMQCECHGEDGFIKRQMGRASILTQTFGNHPK